MSAKHTLILNSTNKINDNTYQYRLPNNITLSKNDKIGLESLSIYNSFFNIEASRGNNTISLIWNANTTVQYDWVIPDGNYSLDQLNLWLQSKMAYNNLYLINSDGDIVYYVEFLIEATKYAISLTCFPLPTSANATTLGYVKPSGATWNFPVSDKTTQITLSTGLGKLLGFTPSTYPNSIQSTTQVFYSDSAPQLSPVNSIIICCNLLNNSLAIPNNILSSMPLIKNFGELMNYQFDSPTLINVAPSSYSTITIGFFDQLYQKLYIRDQDVIIRIIIEINEEQEKKK